MLRIINDFTHSYLSLRELLAAGLRLSQVFKRAFRDDAYVGRHIAELDAANERLKTSYQRSTASEYTEKLAARDRARDAAFRSAVGYLEGMASVSAMQEIALPAAKLLSIFEKHDRCLYRFGYARQSAALDALLKELSTPRAAQLTQMANAGVVLDYLQQKQRDFEDLYQSKISDESAENYPASKAAASDIIYRIECLIQYIDSHAVDQPDAYRQVAAELNMVISDIMSPARAHQTRRENESEEEPAVEA
jgi:hypothetical protein